MKKLAVALLCVIIIPIGCVSKTVIVVDSATVPFTSIEAEPYSMMPYKIGVVLNDAFTSKIARASDTYKDKEYVFEARLGQDMQQSMPAMLEKHFKEVIVLKDLHGAGPDFDYVLVPDISRSNANVVVRMSTVPLYELTVSLRVNIFRDGHPYDFFNIVETKSMEVPLSNKKETERQELVQKGYDKLMTRIYTHLSRALRQL